MVLLKRFATLRWKLAFSYVGVTLFTVLALEILIILGASWFGEEINKLWVKQLTMFQARQLAQQLVEPLEANSAEHLLEILDQRIELVIDIAPLYSTGTDYQLNETRMVLDMQGRILASTHPEHYPVGEIYTDSLVAQFLTRGNTASHLEESTGLYTVVTPIIDAQGTYLGVLYYQGPTIDFAGLSLSQLWFPLLITTLVLLPCMIPLGLIFGFVTSVNFTRRLSRLAETSSALAAGNLDCRINDSSDDEIGQLARQFDAMAEQLQTDTIQLRDLADHNAKLAQKNQQLIALEERHRLARDLHDGVKQHLFGVNLATSAALNLLDVDADTARIRLLEAKDHSRQAQVEMQALLNELRSIGLDERGLVVALTNYLDTFEKRWCIQVNWQTVGANNLTLPPLHEQTLFRVAQEALTNVVRHAQATQVNVSLCLEHKNIILSIVDNGKGFDITNIETGTTMGLQGMKERVVDLGGTLMIESSPAKGTWVYAELPYSDNA